ncbi:MAG: SGNH/GDSL hydrolase family protein [Synechocystis sp.]|nr:SGNH/GDSL hydrolase family protein [Synechocystis sp.]
MTPKVSSLKPVLINASLVLGSMVFALGLVEIALRILGIGYPSFYEVDPHRGHRLIPNMTARWRHEGNGLVKINAEGLRDRHYEVEKPPQTYRIVVLGDSFSEAIQLDADKTFWSAMERRLPDCAALAGKTVEVINFGVGDYGTAQAYMTLKHQALSYQPDLVLLALYTGNDLVNNSQALSPGDRLSPFWQPVDGQWQMNMDFKDTDTYRRRDSFARRFVFGLINHSRLLQVLNEAKRVLVTRQTLTTQSSEQTDIIPALDFDVNLYQEPTSPAWQLAWSATESLIAKINQESQAHQADFVTVTLSNPPQVYPDRQVRQRLIDLGAKNLFYPDQRLANFGQRQGIEVITLAPLFQQQADQTGTYWHGFDNTLMGVGHWNENGHQFAGEVIGDRLCQRLTTP